ncbi:hypothetical protein [Flavimarina sp. Hel_I_48]|uniref:hypothetical protein n=1 Tax=Flavimarina sp. Hel_I_48 TaxID=1392488 RepID=UPI0004DF11A1|nr:hypothetical protein [Flavimarina sp. Hel_I_48]
MLLSTRIALQSKGFFGVLGERIQEGGTFAMSLIVISFLIMLFLIVRAFLKLKAPKTIFDKLIKLINQLALIALTIGLFNQWLGLIQVFDSFESLNDVEPQVFASGLKITLLSVIFGGFVFLVGRIMTFVLTWFRQESE